MDPEAELDWVSECFFAIFQSPTWTGPIGKFVDEHSGTFEDAEENKLEYTPIHNAFKVLVDDLLTASMMELSVTPEQFARFCEEGLRGDKALHRSVIERLLSVDDFLVFKAMMVKRNAELHREALLGPATSDDASAELDGAAALPDEDDSNADSNLDPSEEERLDAQRRCVEAELQLAIALSYQLEQRLRLIEAIEERLRLIEKLSEVMEATAEMDRQREEELMAEATAAAEALSRPMLELEPSPLVSDRAVTAAAPLSLFAQATRLTAEEISIPKAVQLQPLKLRGTEGREGAPTLAAAPPAPELTDAERWELEKKRSEAALQRAAGTERRAAASQRREQAAAVTAAPAPVSETAAPPAPPPVAGPTEEERQTRQAHLKRQREALIEKKNRQREGQLASFQQTNGSSAATRVAERRMLGSAAPPEDMGRKLAAELGGLQQGESPDEQEAARVAASEAAALEMRRTITRHPDTVLTVAYNSDLANMYLVGIT